jgi:hypothetical protein
VTENYSGEPLAGKVVGGYYGAITHHPAQEAPPMIQIRTAEGILTLSNASDVRTTGILCVRGHKGVTLGYIAPLPAGGWVCMDDAQALEAYLDANTNLRDRNDVTLEQAAALLVTTD